MAAQAAPLAPNPLDPAKLSEPADHGLVAQLPAAQPAAFGQEQLAPSRRSEQLDQLFSALVAAQTELIDPDVDQSSPDFPDHRYASLPSFLVPNRVVLQRHGLAVLQTPDGQALVTMLVHRSGQFIAGRTPLMLVSDDMQGLGSAIAYARRYGYQSMLGLVQMDDDGRRAVRAATAAAGVSPLGSQTPSRPLPADASPGAVAGAAATGAAALMGSGSASGANAAAGPGAAKVSGFNLQATVDAIGKKTLIGELDLALIRVRSLFTGADLVKLEAAIADRRAAIVAASAAALP